MFPKHITKGTFPVLLLSFDLLAYTLSIDHQCDFKRNFTVTVVRGQSVSLPCNLKSILEKFQTAIWRKENGDSLVKCSILDGCMHLQDKTLQRYKVLTHFEKNFTLNITRVQLNDADTYHCDVFAGTKLQCEVSLVQLSITDQLVTIDSLSRSASITSSNYIVASNLSTTYSPITHAQNERLITVTKPSIIGQSYILPAMSALALVVATVLISWKFFKKKCTDQTNLSRIEINPTQESVIRTSVAGSEVVNLMLFPEMATTGRDGDILVHTENQRTCGHIIGNTVVNLSDRQSSELPGVPTTPSPSKDTEMSSELSRGDCNSSSMPSFDGHLCPPQKQDADLQLESCSVTEDLTSSGEMVQTCPLFDEAVHTASGDCVSFPRFGSEESCSGVLQSAYQVPRIFPLKVTRTYFSTSPKLPLESAENTARESDGDVSILNGTTLTPSLCVRYPNKRDNAEYPQPVAEEEHTYFDLDDEGPPLPPRILHKILPRISLEIIQEHDTVQHETALAESTTSQSSPISMDGHTWHNVGGEGTIRSPAERFRKYIQSNLSISIRRGRREGRARPDIVDFPPPPPFPTSSK